MFTTLLDGIVELGGSCAGEVYSDGFMCLWYSLGGVETLITRPATSTHNGLTAKEREAAGVSDTLIRLSVGIEEEADLIADFKQGLGIAEGTIGALGRALSGFFTRAS